MFSKSAHLYDAVYHWKNYELEAHRVREIVAKHKRSSGNSLLDVACGTGAHLPFLRTDFAVEGLDLDDGLLSIARGRCPDVTFHLADMTDFDLDRQYDCVVCLFRAIGYVCSVSRLQLAACAMAQHLAPGGVMLVEPWIFEGEFHEDQLHGLYIDNPELKISRMNLSKIIPCSENPISVIDFHYQVGTLSGIDQFTERHELGLFTRDQYEAAFRRAGLNVSFDVEAFPGGGLYIAEKPLD